MGAAARNKGAAGEREFNALLAPAVSNACTLANVPGIRLSRNFAQSSEGGCDLNVLAKYGFAFEVKRHETLQINTWWAQIVKAAAKENAWPFLAYRQNRKPWTFVVDCRVLWIESEGRVYMEEAVFLAWFEKTLAERLRSYHGSINVAPTPPNNGV